ncbi:CFA/I fimbrial subunit C usher protein [Klebsiella pneumoniae IS39]|nr:CFA/I fimbrial subunit C usher protein [Klebsiella pneumoniae IS39]
MSVPLYIHLAGSQSTRDDQRIGSAFIWLDGGQLRVRQIQLEESEGNASVSETDPPAADWPGQRSVQ